MTKIDSACSVPACSSVVRCKGLCEQHYRRMMKHGSPCGGATSPGEVARFYEALLSHTGDECVTWPYARGDHGYGTIRRRRKCGIVSRFLCEDIHGSPPSTDYQAAHSCGNGHLGCVNPRHLSWKTRSDNKADELLHGTRIRGRKFPWAKLTESQVEEILCLDEAEKNADIAERYGVSPRTIYSIRHEEKWAWVVPKQEKSNAA